jgi:hypothetical protein
VTKQNQKGGDGSVNVQGLNVTVNTGLSLKDAKQIATDVFNANFLELIGVAKETAEARANELIEKFLTELKNRNPDGVESARDPDFQYGLFLAQREYARSGARGLDDLLVDLLVDRTQRSDRGLVQIVLNESLGVAPKLTDPELSVLTIAFLLKYARYTRMANLDSLKSYFEDQISPFVTNLPTRQSEYQHLVYASCGTISIGSMELGQGFLKTYPGVFSTGFTQDQLTEKCEWRQVSALVTACLRDPNKLQMNAIDRDALERKAKQVSAGPEVVDVVWNLNNSNLMTKDKVVEYLRQVHPCAEKLLQVWQDTPLKSLSLTSVGIAIGHANLRRTTGEQADISIWI